MAKTKEDYLELGLLDAQADSVKNKPKKEGWQLHAYLRGRGDGAVKITPAVTKTAGWKKLADMPLRGGLFLSDQNYFPRVVSEHLRILNDRYRRAINPRYEERLMGSIGRILSRWMPRA